MKAAILGKKLHEKAPECFGDLIKKGVRVEECFKKLMTCTQTEKLFKELIGIVNKNTDEKRLYESLKHVCKLTEMQSHH